ncbi:Gfo/Idh/MocA family protein [Chloroflexota bacterium]
MKFLIAGLGSIGRRHLRNLIALGENDILLYRTHSSTLPDKDLGDFPVESSLDAALAQKPTAVIVSNPTSLHLDIAIPAAEAGCHLFLEKPISHSFHRVPEFKYLVEQQKVQVFTGFQFRFHPGLIATKRLLSEGAIGKPLSVRAHWGEYLPNWHPWEDYRHSYSARPDLGGGVILTLSHPLDYLRWLIGAVKSLWAFTGQLSDLELKVEDNAEIGLQFDNGVLGSVHLDYNQRPSSHHLEIIGSQGTIRWEFENGAAQVYRVEFGNWEIFNPPEGYDRNDMFMAEMRHFLDVLKGQTAPICNLFDGIRALELALAAHRSQRNRMVIDLM